MKIIRKEYRLKLPGENCSNHKSSERQLNSNVTRRRQEATMEGQNFSKDHRYSSSAIRISEVQKNGVTKTRKNGVRILMVSNETESMTAFCKHLEGRSPKLFKPAIIVGQVEKVHFWACKGKKVGSKKITGSDLDQPIKCVVYQCRDTVTHLSVDSVNLQWASLLYAMVSMPNLKKLSTMDAAVVGIPLKLRDTDGALDYVPGRIPINHSLYRLILDGCTFEHAAKLIDVVYYGLKQKLRSKFYVDIRNPQSIKGKADLDAMKWMIKHFKEDEAEEQNQQATKEGKQLKHFYHTTEATFRVDFMTAYEKSRTNRKQLDETKQQHSKILEELEEVIRPVKNYYKSHGCKSKLTKLLVEHESFGLDQCFDIMQANAEATVDILQKADFQNVEIKQKSKTPDGENQKKRLVHKPWTPGYVRELKRVKRTIDD